ncbi:MAG TPA: amidohydrolase family protein [Acidimicrobiales bacterium]|nr:amidohydrolase family protein [Acidimicrobiales bacterium]
MAAPSPTYDLHAHCTVPAGHALAAGDPGVAAEAARLAAGTGEAAAAANRALGREWLPRLVDADERLAVMDRRGIDVQAVSPSPGDYHYGAGEHVAADIVAAVNEGVAALCARHPDRLVGLGSVALQHPALAADQLRHAVGRLGLAGAVVGTHAGGRDLSDPAFEPLWAAAEETGAVLFLHPWGCTLGERLARAYLFNVVGNPTETALALSHLIFGGVLDRFPGLRVLAAHGGGYLPFYPGRADHAHRVRQDSRTCAEPPSTYLRRLWFDSVVHESRLLGHLVANVGADRVVLGTDYPFDMGQDDPVGMLDAVDGLGAADRAAVAGGNAAALLGRA